MADSYEGCVYVGAGSAEPKKLITGEPLKYPAGIALIDHDGILIADPHAKMVWKWNGEKLEPAVK